MALETKAKHALHNRAWLVEAKEEYIMLNAIQQLANIKEANDKAKMVKWGGQREIKTHVDIVPNKYGYYTMKQYYLISFLLGSGEKVSENQITYQPKGKKYTKTYTITKPEAFNRSCEIYETLRGAGYTNICDILEYSPEKISFIQKTSRSSTGYVMISIDGEGQHDSEYGLARNSFEPLKRLEIASK